MKRRFFVAFLGFAAVLGLAVASYAGDVTIKFTNPKSAPHNTYGGFYVGIYLGTVNGAHTEFVCDDFLHDIVGSQQWSAVPGSTNPVSSGVEFSPGSITNPNVLTWEHNNGSLNQQDEYNMITYLADQIFADQNNSKGQWGYLSWAIWSITDHAWHSSNYNSYVRNYVAQALAHDNNNGDLHVFTPAPYSSGQEFLSPVPEAGSVLLLGIFLAAGAALLLTKKKLATPELLGDC